MTNGEKIKATFPHYDIEIDEHKGYVRVFYEDFYTTYPLRWWNAEYKEPTTNNEVKYCDRNICLKNEYNNIGCENCEVTKSQEPTTKNDLADREHKGEVMDFPNTFDEFVKDYGFRDKQEVYTNGSELIPVFRVKQWLEHIATTKNDLAVSSGLEKNSKKLEKDFGELDCISRADVLQILLDYDYANENALVLKDIKALPPVTPQPCDDAVSRQALLNATVKKSSIWNKTTDSKGENLETIISNLPPVTSQPRKGHWKLVQRGKFIDVCCSNCEAVRNKGYAYNYTIDELNKEENKKVINEYFGSAEMRFCPNCGADMREVEE